jgi:hypothetical protein
MLSTGLSNFVYRHFIGQWDSGEGGYPPDIVFLPGHVVLAMGDPSKDYNRAMLEIISNKDVRIWHKRTRWLHRKGKLEWDDAAHEAYVSI